MSIVEKKRGGKKKKEDLVLDQKEKDFSLLSMWSFITLFCININAKLPHADAHKGSNRHSIPFFFCFFVQRSRSNTKKKQNMISPLKSHSKTNQKKEDGKGE